MKMNKYTEKKFEKILKFILDSSLKRYTFRKSPDIILIYFKKVLFLRKEEGTNEY